MWEAVNKGPNMPFSGDQEGFFGITYGAKLLHWSLRLKTKMGPLCDYSAKNSNGPTNLTLFHNLHIYWVIITGAKGISASRRRGGCDGN